MATRREQSRERERENEADAKKEMRWKKCDHENNQLWFKLNIKWYLPLSNHLHWKLEELLVMLVGGICFGGEDLCVGEWLSAHCAPRSESNQPVEIYHWCFWRDTSQLMQPPSSCRLQPVTDSHKTFAIINCSNFALLLHHHFAHHSFQPFILDKCSLEAIFWLYKWQSKSYT